MDKVIIEVKSWQFEDEMTEDSMYSALFPLSIVSDGGIGVRIFPKEIAIRKDMKKWYYKQEKPHLAYDIYNPNQINSYVCQVCSKQEAEDIVDAMNTRKDSLDGLLENPRIITRKEISLEELEEFIEEYSHKNLVEKDENGGKVIYPNFYYPKRLAKAIKAHIEREYNEV